MSEVFGHQLRLRPCGSEASWRTHYLPNNCDPWRCGICLPRIIEVCFTKPYIGQWGNTETFVHKKIANIGLKQQNSSLTCDECSSHVTTDSSQWCSNHMFLELLFCGRDYKKQGLSLSPFLALQQPRTVECTCLNSGSESRQAKFLPRVIHTIWRYMIASCTTRIDDASPVSNCPPIHLCLGQAYSPPSQGSPRDHEIWSDS